VGAERFSNYTGYSSSFEFAGAFNDPTPVDAAGRVAVALVAMDALQFREPLDQFSCYALERELLKAYVAFSWPVEAKNPHLKSNGLSPQPTEEGNSLDLHHPHKPQPGSSPALILPVPRSELVAALSPCTCQTTTLSAKARTRCGSEGAEQTTPTEEECACFFSFRTVSTGNWGCGAFRGDVGIKSMIQWLAAGLAGRHLRYFTFQDTEAAKLPQVATLLAQQHATVGQLWAEVCRYARAMCHRRAKMQQLMYGGGQELSDDSEGLESEDDDGWPRLRANERPRLEKFLELNAEGGLLNHLLTVFSTSAAELP
jgi:poly(ADP-ribose) glycohydrolase